MSFPREDKYLWLQSFILNALSKEHQKDHAVQGTPRRSPVALYSMLAYKKSFLGQATLQHCWRTLACFPRPKTFIPV